MPEPCVKLRYQLPSHDCSIESAAGLADVLAVRRNIPPVGARWHADSAGTALGRLPTSRTSFSESRGPQRYPGYARLRDLFVFRVDALSVGAHKCLGECDGYLGEVTFDRLAAAGASGRPGSAQGRLVNAIAQWLMLKQLASAGTARPRRSRTHSNHRLWGEAGSHIRCTRRRRGRRRSAFVRAAPFCSWGT